MSTDQITEQAIRRLVDEFYLKVRADPDLGPIFARAIPGDWEAQVGQGPITFHSEENLASSDRGVGRLRAFLRQQIKTAEEGGDPLGLIYDPRDETYVVKAGNFFI